MKQSTLLLLVSTLALALNAPLAQAGKAQRSQAAKPAAAHPAHATAALRTGAALAGVSALAARQAAPTKAPAPEVIESDRFRYDSCGCSGA